MDFTHDFDILWCTDLTLSNHGYLKKLAIRGEAVKARPPPYDLENNCSNRHHILEEHSTLC